MLSNVSRIGSRGLHCLPSKCQEEQIQIGLAVDIIDIFENTQLIAFRSLCGVRNIIQSFDADRGDGSTTYFQLGNCQQGLQSDEQRLQQRRKKTTLTTGDTEGTLVNACVGVPFAMIDEQLNSRSDVVDVLLDVGRDVISAAISVLCRSSQNPNILIAGYRCLATFDMFVLVVLSLKQILELEG